MNYRQHTLLPLLSALLAVAALGCSYEETVDVTAVTITLSYPEEGSPYEGARVEMTDATSSTFVSLTDSVGTAHFLLPPGIYDASSTDTHLEDHVDEGYAWRYTYNGVRSRIVITSDSTTSISLPLTMSRRKILY